MSAGIVELESGAQFWDDATELGRCLHEPVPRIPPWFGYDARGSELFEAITELPTYYLTRVERALLEQHADEIVERLGCARIAELGSGSAKKTRLLLEAATRLRATTYLPVDVSREMLEHSRDLLAEVPGLTVTGLWGRYEAGLECLRTEGGPPTAVLFLGANVGNATASERDLLLRRTATTLRPGDALLVSADLIKPGPVFERCYNDPPGHAAFSEFRLNHLDHLVRRFDGEADRGALRARAHYDPVGEVVEGVLWAESDQRITLPGLGTGLELRRGEGVNVGFSAKFDRGRFVEEVEARGLILEDEWIDEVHRYGIFLFRR